MNRLNILNSILMTVFGVFFIACAPSKQQGEYTPHQSENIIGGTDLSHNKTLNKSLVLILNQNVIGSASICTGTFITDTVILTAAHCVSDDKNDLVIRMGNSIFSDKEPVAFKVLAVQKHEKYQQNENDLALILVEKNLQQNVLPIEILNNSESARKKNMMLFGYGVNQIDESDDEFQGAGDLRSLKVISARIKMDHLTFTIDQSQGSGACHGDSGGPAFITLPNHKQVLVGVASGVVQSDDQSECSNQSVYTNVSTYKSWIYKTTEKINSFAITE